MKVQEMLYYAGGTFCVAVMLKTGLAEAAVNSLTNNVLFKPALSALLVVTAENFIFSRKLKHEVVLTKIGAYMIVAFLAISFYNNR